MPFLFILPICSILITIIFIAIFYLDFITRALHFQIALLLLTAGRLIKSIPIGQLIIITLIFLFWHINFICATCSMNLWKRFLSMVKKKYFPEPGMHLKIF